jgi:hypothetical protein
VVVGTPNNDGRDTKVRKAGCERAAKRTELERLVLADGGPVQEDLFSSVLVNNDAPDGDPPARDVAAQSQRRHQPDPTVEP